MVNLVKGQKVELTKSNPGLTKINAGLGWDVNAFDSGSQFDLDAEVFLLGDNGKVTSDGDFVFYGNTVHASGSVEHTGDNRDGAGDGDDETIKIDLSKVPQNISRITFAVTIYDAAVRNQNFGQVNNAFIRIYNPDTNEELRPHRGFLNRNRAGHRRTVPPRRRVEVQRCRSRISGRT